MTYEAPKLRTTLVATGVALLVAGVVLVGAVLPAEYGIDPTGVGGTLGLTSLQDAEPKEEAVNRTPAQTLQEYRGTWPTATATALSTDAYVDSEAVELIVPVDEPNLVRFEVVVTWMDDNATAEQGTEPDVVELAITPPRGVAGVPTLARNGVDGAGRLEAGRSVLSAPLPATVPAASPEDAFFAFQDLHPPDHTGTGPWKLQLRIEPGQTRIQGIEVPQTDAGNDVHVEVLLTTYALDTNVTATGRATTHVFDLDAGRGMEFKVYVDEGDAFDYAWNTTAGELYYDFHGDPAGGDGSDFVRHGEGEAPAADGTFTAPFAGNYGWYWQNTHPEAVRVTLVLRGTYVLLLG